MDVKILGTGCANCQRLEARVRQAAADAGLEPDIEKVTDIPAIMGYGVMRTPALVIDGQVLLSGRVPTVAQIAELLAAHAR